MLSRETRNARKKQRDEENMERELAKPGREEQAFREKVIRYQKRNGLRGFFPVRRWMRTGWLRWEWTELWTASALVKRAQETGILEFGGMSYVLGEVYWGWRHESLGEYYPYRRRGEHDHEHCFFTVLTESILNDGQVTAEGEDYYAPWMLEYLDRVRDDAKLRRRLLPWAKKPWKGVWRLKREGLGQPVIRCWAGKKRRRCRDEEAVYGMAARYWEDFRLEEPELLSPQQRENIRAILDYQRAAKAGLAD